MATPVEHYEMAEDLLARAAQLARTAEELATAGDLTDAARIRVAATLTSHDRLTAAAAAHAQLAAVAWGGDDRDLEEVARGLDGEQVAALVALAEELRRWGHAPAVLPTTGNGSRYEEGHVDGWEAARDVVRGLVEPIAREVLDR